TPASEYASDAAVTAAASIRTDLAPYMTDLMTGDINTRRAILDEHFYGPKIETARSLYPVTQRVEEIAGVYTEVFEPAAGIAADKQNKVLINLHGGGFSMGARTEGRLESIPVAAVSGLRVISIDYRQGPEHKFPAASEDVAAVYMHLLEQYQAENIGIFGCSAGGMLTAQAVAWFDKHELPKPAAIGIFCSGAGEFGKGDAAIISDLVGSRLSGGEIEYFSDASWNDPLVSPQEDPQLLSRFPDTLVITSTRDLALSGALVTHYRLLEQGVYSQLHVYEGLGHYFFADTELKESKHVFDVISKFFTERLGSNASKQAAVSFDQIDAEAFQQ
ncbi:MAG: alpha/beta hydrolase, partial [Pseudomonadales bacterium]